MNPEVAVIINSFNRLVLLQDCLPNIIESLEAIKIPAVFIILDAGSTDGSVEYVQQMQQGNAGIILVAVKAEENISFSAGCNRAIKEALDRYPTLPYLLFFETDNLFKDVLPLQQAFQLIKEKPELASVGFWIEKITGEKMVYGNSTPSVAGFILGQPLATRLGIEQVTPKWIASNTGSEYTYTSIVFTSPLLVRAKAWTDAGGMDEQNFPFSDSDTDLCLKFIQAGYKNVVLNGKGVVHDNRNNKSSWSGKRVYNYHQARFRLLTKHKAWSKGILQMTLPLRHAMELLMGKLMKKSPDYLDNRKQLLFSAWKGYRN